MAKTRSGIIGNLKGNIAGVNGGVVKSQCYLRSRWSSQSKENSPSKQHRIGNFIAMANVWKFFADPFLRFLWYNTYNPAIAYHKFMKLNVPLLGEADEDTFVQFEPFLGPLSPPTITRAQFKPPAGIKVFYTSPSLITTQSDLTDTIVCMMFDVGRSIFFMASVNVDRTNNSFTVAPELSALEANIVIKIGFTPFRSAFNMSPTSKHVLVPTVTTD